MQMKAQIEELRLDEARGAAGRFYITLSVGALDDGVRQVLQLVSKLPVDVVVTITRPSPKGVERDKKDWLGMVVREAWVRWAQGQPNPKASWLAPWEDLPAEIQEAERRIGCAVAEAVWREVEGYCVQVEVLGAHGLQVRQALDRVAKWARGKAVHYGKEW
jgi:hypothetical protein